MSHYTLYGSYASYYSAKVRSYLRKKGIPFVERLPSDPVFRNQVRPQSGTHRIPQLMTPAGQIVQDSVEIVDTLETRFPELPAFPKTPRQRLFVHLMELFGSEALVRLAWLHRWMFSENNAFVTMDFGRSFKPQGSDEELAKYGNLIADRMRSYGLPESTSAVRTALDSLYTQLLTLFETHLVAHPYLLGGHPSAADYAVMGAMHAHLGRDPAGLRIMQDHAPRTFRWVEHMMVPEVQSPEFYARPVEYLPDDEVPQSALDILNFIVGMKSTRAYMPVAPGEQYLLSALAFDQSMERQGAMSGFQLAPDQDQPGLPDELVQYEGVEVQHSANVYAVWLLQRSQKYLQTLTDTEQGYALGMLDPGPLVELTAMLPRYSLARVNNRFVLE